MLTREDDVDAHALHRRGWTISAIARHLGHTLCDLLILVEQSAESVAPRTL
jgi:hypothetical protein